MGSQVNFFMSYEDEQAFNQVVIKFGGCLISKRSQTEVVHLVPFLAPVPERVFPGELCIVHRDHIAGVRLYFVDGVEQYFVDEDNSPVIQFHRSWRKDNTLFRGRIWCQFESRLWDAALANEVVTEKDKGFQSFYNSLARWIRRNYRRDPQFGFFIGDHAWKWYVAGGEISLH